jgi:hypothetical protein
VDADPVEIRVLGSLVEKRRTTPDAYPLSLNALRLACNQATSREPVVDYDEPTIRAALIATTSPRSRYSMNPASLSPLQSSYRCSSGLSVTRISSIVMRTV